MTLSTEQAIVEAATIVFNSDYFAPLEKVAERAGISRRTLHRYFTGREELLARCAVDMQRICRQALIQALASSVEPLIQLENMLYAGVECGSRYAFFRKLHTRPDHHHAPQQATACAEYDDVQTRCYAVITRLQRAGLISAQLTPEWVLLLLSGVVKTTIDAREAGATELQLRESAWFSFSKGIGL